ncbi:MAG: tRNA uridine-5-carboxymethylaminomethyl(34) synthesis GTPase MnmE [Candidatus Shikimatogenerans sp. Ttur]|uniref:tRNA modification GTPase MnmE n=1 Tax=Candidatus Shikimatogenerans sp. Ttur TaxID=3158569 RepID=A0AAU7ZXF4_9FLAO
MKTITNIATCNENNSAIAIIRLSGKKTFNIIKKIFNKNIIYKKPILGDIVYKKKIIDEVIIIFYKKPKSYTGENLAEIFCHGSLYIQKKILKILIKLGARISRTGEFTYRAFLNNKINLLKAQSINNLILSKNKYDHKINILNYKKNNFIYFKKIKKKIINILSIIELNIDFSEENIFIKKKKILNKIKNIIKKFKKIIKYFNIYKNKFYYNSILLFGNTNVGKSTLLNILIKKKRSIVSSIKGTTRDYIVDFFYIKKYKFKIIDSAGIKNIKNNIDKISIKKSFSLINKVNLILFIFNKKTFKKDYKLYTLIKKKKKKIIKIINKIDINNNNNNIIFNKKYIKISAKKNKGIKKLKKKILLFFKNNKKIKIKNIIITDLNNINYLKLSIKYLLKVKKKILNNSIYYDKMYFNILKSLKYLNYILGINITNKKILKNIFSKFCIGK